MVQQIKPTVLAIGVAGLRVRTSLLDVYTATTLREAIGTIQLICFDLMVVGLENPRLDVWELIQRVLAAWPHQRWILVSKRVTAEDEVQARSLGALMVLYEFPEEVWLADFAASLRRRDLSRNVRTLAAVDTITPRIEGVAVHAEAT
jgi:DNA-binding response OmpR family regulator